MGQSDRITLLTPNWWRSEKSNFLKLNKRKNYNLPFIEGERYAKFGLGMYTLEYIIWYSLDCNS